MSHCRKRVNATATRKPSWRDVLQIHRAADEFPLMSSDELRTLSEDIKANGLQIPITVLVDKRGDEWIYQLLDGRNRLDAIELAGFDPISPPRGKGRTQLRREGRDCGLDLSLGLPSAVAVGIRFESGLDENEVRALVISANIRRRHLKPKQKRDLIAKLLKATPEKSDRQIAEAAKSNRTTVGQIRKTLEKVGDVSIVDTRTDSTGREQPAHKASAAKPAAATSTKTACVDIGPASTGEMARKDAEIEALRSAKRQLEIKIAELESEIEELRGKLATGTGGDMSISEFQAAIKKWEDTVETQNNIIRDLQNENAKLRAGVATPPADDGLDIPKILLRKPKEIAL
jgi:ParB-like chromosome segregation protein Spo0J